LLLGQFELGSQYRTLIGEDYIPPPHFSKVVDRPGRYTWLQIVVYTIERQFYNASYILEANTQITIALGRTLTAAEISSACKART